MRTVVVAGLALLCGCSRSNNLLLGRVESAVGGHPVVVTDCYRTSVPPPVRVEGGWQWTPCRDADIHIRNGELEVNGRGYGKIGEHDGVLVDHGVVSVQRK
jgi:hypothetical protein